jgi:DNA repair exonuclease SbcCD nuclease subunit
VSLTDKAANPPPPPSAPLSDRDLIVELEERGYVITANAPREPLVDMTREPAGTFRFAVVSDTHLGHIKQQLTHLEDFYRQASVWGAEFMLHAGDLVDGQRMHRDQEFEIFRHGVAAQGRYAAEKLPVLWGKRDRKKVALPQYIIGGNHDGSGWNSAGADVLDVLASHREHNDVTVLGAPAATFTFGGIRIYLLHPDGGVAYARSYKLQKIVEGFEADSKPHLLLCGHWHVQCHVSTRNVEAFALPCFQAQTAYIKRKGLMPVIGGYLFEVTYDETGLVDLTAKFVRYSNPIPNDYP